MFLLLHNSMEKFELSCYMVVHLHNSLTHFGFPDGSVVKNLPANAGDAGLIPRSGRSPGVGNAKFAPAISDREAWHAAVYGVAVG